MQGSDTTSGGADVASQERNFPQYVDHILTRFATERLKYSSDSFRSRFVSYLHLSHPGAELQRFLRTASTVSRVNVHIYQFFRNPLYQLEFPLLFVAFSVIILGLFFLASQPELGLFLISGAVVQLVAMLQKLGTEYCENDIQVSIYGELQQIIEVRVAGMLAAWSPDPTTVLTVAQ